MRARGDIPQKRTRGAASLTSSNLPPKRQLQLQSLASYTIPPSNDASQSSSSRVRVQHQPPCQKPGLHFPSSGSLSGRTEPEHCSPSPARTGLALARAPWCKLWSEESKTIRTSLQDTEFGRLTLLSLLKLLQEVLLLRHLAQDGARLDALSNQASEAACQVQVASEGKICVCLFLRCRPARQERCWRRCELTALQCRDDGCAFRDDCG